MAPRTGWAMPGATSSPTTSPNARTTCTWPIPSCAPARLARNCAPARCRRTCAAPAACAATARWCGRSPSSPARPTCATRWRTWRTTTSSTPRTGARATCTCTPSAPPPRASPAACARSRAACSRSRSQNWARRWPTRCRWCRPASPPAACARCERGRQQEQYVNEPRYSSYIAGQWVEGGGSHVDENPANLDAPVGHYGVLDAAAVGQAVDAAAAALPAWSLATPQQRAEVLDFVGSEILARKEELGRLLAREEGKTLAESI